MLSIVWRGPDAWAQAPKIFVASFGNDANDGSRNSPKRNFQAAHDAVAASGQIVVLDTAGYGALTITKSLAITVPPGVNGFVTVSGMGNGITINAAANDTVSLRGLIVEGSNGGGSGIAAGSVGTVEIADCLVRRFFNGIRLRISNGATAQLENTTCRNNTVGFELGPVGDVKVKAVATNCRFLSNTLGASVTLGSGVGAATAELTLADCVADNNAGAGITVDAAAATARVDHCRITNNGGGVTRATGTGALLTLGNNTFANNTNDGAFTGSISPQ